MMKVKKILSVLFLGILIVVGYPVFKVNALNYGQGTYGTCTYNTCGITITSSSNINVDLTPDAGGKCSTNYDNVSVLTDSSTGYSLSMSTNNSSTSLSNGSSNITAVSGTFTSPSAIGLNSWGYRIDNAAGSGFGPGPTSVLANSTYPMSLLFAGAPNNTGSPTTIVNSVLPANPAAVTKVWYGVCADTSLSSGTYSGTILYSATTN
jgi:hypothetical protein